MKEMSFKSGVKGGVKGQMVRTKVMTVMRRHT